MGKNGMGKKEQKYYDFSSLRNSPDPSAVMIGELEQYISKIAKQYRRPSMTYPDLVTEIINYLLMKMGEQMYESSDQLQNAVKSSLPRMLRRKKAKDWKTRLPLQSLDETVFFDSAKTGYDMVSYSQID